MTTAPIDIRFRLKDRVSPLLRRVRLAYMEHAFWQDAKRWQREGSGMTREQETGAAMVWSWLKEHEES